MEKIIMAIIGSIFIIIIAYLIGLNENIKEKECYRKGYEYYRDEYFHLKLQICKMKDLK